MSAISSSDKVVTQTQLENDLSAFYATIRPFLNGAAHAGFTPVGTVISVMGTHAPQNYLICNGQTVNITDYPELASYFETEFGTKNHFGGDGTTTFAVPDLRGEFLRGAGTNSHTNQGDGANVGAHQDATEIPAFQIYNKALSGRTSGGGYSIYSNADAYQNQTEYVQLSTGTLETGEAGIGIFTSRPTNTSVLYCIATKNIYVDARYDYSTTEKVVGTWIDGKPLYQKTVSVDVNVEVASGELVTVAIMDASGINIKNYDSYYVASSGSIEQIPYTTVSGTNIIRLIHTRYKVDDTVFEVCVRNLSAASQTTTCTVITTVQYTKTTD